MIENTISTNENLVQVFCGVRGYEQDGVAHLHIEDAARGLGFTTKVNDTEYVRWPRVDEYLGDFGFLPQVANEENPHDYYIPENIFYRLCMKAKNEVAEKFQAKVADEIIPSIRKTGSYSVNQQQAQPTIFDYARALIAEKERSDALEAQNKALTAERDEAIRTKSQISDKKTASAMGTAGAKSKECERLRKKLEQVESEMELKIHNACSAILKEYEESWTTAREWCYKHGLPTHPNQPKWTVSAKLAEICLTYPNREKWRTNASDVRIFPKWACDILDKMYDEDSTFLSEYRTV